ncbi:MAG TPA: ATP-binding protein, partial [Flavisolibacter sp.]|nr:ATP-binding protein [Flavisolibacter sp.]
FEEVIRIKKDSTVRQLKVKGDVIYNHKKEPYKLVGIDLDITDINEVKAKLETSKRWLQQTAEASPDAITIYNLSKKFPIYLNDRLAEWLQTTSEELLNIGIEGRLKLIHPDDRLTILHFNEKVAASADGQILTLDYRLKPSDDKILWIRNRAKVFERDAEGKVTQILSILQDITEEKKSEVKLQDLNQSLRKKNKDLEIKNEEITSFAFVGSHDLKEPIRKLHLFSDWLLEKEKKNISAQGINYLQGMIESVNRLDMLIEDLLILTKMNSSSDELTDVDLNKVAASSLKEMKDEIEKVNARITIPDLPVIKGNENQLLYLFKNMISNAIKFQVPGNQPIVKIEAKEVNGREIQNASVGLNKNYLSISFCDNGIGFNKVHEKKIFEIFRRLHSKEVYPGSGIGLTICKKVMERQGGFITVDSKVGIGSQFHCYFPLYS